VKKVRNAPVRMRRDDRTRRNGWGNISPTLLRGKRVGKDRLLGTVETSSGEQACWENTKSVIEGQKSRGTG